MSFSDLGLTPELLRAVADQGYTEPTPVQRESIPLVLARRDLLAGAQTGTGKTAAFVLPILQLLNAERTPGWKSSNQRTVSVDDARRGPVPARHSPEGRRSHGLPGPSIRALVLTPTRELCLQIEESVRTYGAHRRIRSVAIYGGVGYEPQNRALRAGPGIVVATPGRLLDHIEQGHIDLSGLEILVLDEADRMLDMGFIRDIRKVIALLPKDRQTLLFSATFSDDIRSLAHGILRAPATVQVTPRNTPTELVTQVVIPVDRERKRDLLAQLIRSGRIEQALVFSRTKHGANRLAEQLSHDGIAAVAIHGNKSQGQRVRALDDFKAGRASILVATEVASRGLDIEQLPHVVNYELPMVAEDYVHRIGRTGRAGATGDAISLVCVDEGPLLREIERLLGRPIPTEVIPGFEPDRSIARQPIRQQFGGRSVPGSDRSGARRPVDAGRPATERGRSAEIGGRRRGAYGRPVAGSGIGNGNVRSRPGPTAAGWPAGMPAGAGSGRGGPSAGRRFGRPAGPRSGHSGSPDGSPSRRLPEGAARRDGSRFEAMPGERFARSGDPGR